MWGFTEVSMDLKVMFVFAKSYNIRGMLKPSIMMQTK